MASSSSPLATAYPWLHRFLPRAPEKASWRHAGGCARARVWGGSWPPASTLPGSSSCRVRKLVARRILPGRVVRRGKFLVAPWLAFPASSSCRGLVSSRQDPRAEALSLHLEYFVLEGDPREPTEDPGDRPASLAAGALQLPVHEFGILGYPYSSTPTTNGDFPRVKSSLARGNTCQLVVGTDVIHSLGRMRL